MRQEIGKTRPQSKAAKSDIINKYIEQKPGKAEPLPTQPVINSPNCPGGICPIGPILGNPTVNNYAASQPPPTISWNQFPLAPNQNDIKFGGDPEPGQDKPGVAANVHVNSTFVEPAFIVECNIPCIPSAGAAAGMVDVRFLESSKDPNIAGIVFVSPSKLLGGDAVTIVFRSRDERPITLKSIEPYIFPKQ